MTVVIPFHTARTKGPHAGAHPDPSVAHAGVFVDREEARRQPWEHFELELWQLAANVPWMPSSLRQPAPCAPEQCWSFGFVALAVFIYVLLPALSLYRLIAG